MHTPTHNYLQPLCYSVIDPTYTAELALVGTLMNGCKGWSYLCGAARSTLSASHRLLLCCTARYTTCNDVLSSQHWIPVPNGTLAAHRFTWRSPHRRPIPPLVLAYLAPSTAYTIHPKHCRNDDAHLPLCSIEALTAMPPERRAQADGAKAARGNVALQRHRGGPWR